LISITLTLISLSLPYWLWAGASADVPAVRNVDYGLFQRCERRWVSSPPAGRRREYKCTTFPARSACDVDGQFFCIAWHTAGYTSQFSLVFAAAGLVTVTLANITTKKRRRRAWRIVSALVGAHGALQIVAMAIVVSLLHHFPQYFAHGTTFSTSFILNIISWVIDLVLAAGLVITGIYAKKGHRWAAGRRPYRPIPDMPVSSSSG